MGNSPRKLSREPNVSSRTAILHLAKPIPCHTSINLDYNCRIWVGLSGDSHWAMLDSYGTFGYDATEGELVDLSRAGKFRGESVAFGLGR